MRSFVDFYEFRFDLGRSHRLFSTIITNVEITQVICSTRNFVEIVLYNAPERFGSRA